KNLVRLKRSPRLWCPLGAVTGPGRARARPNLLLPATPQFLLRRTRPADLHSGASARPGHDRAMVSGSVFGWRKKPRLEWTRRGLLDCFFVFGAPLPAWQPRECRLITYQPSDQSPLGKRPNALGYHRGPDLPARIPRSAQPVFSCAASPFGLGLSARF